MVSFSNLFTAAVALSAPIAAQLTPAEVVSNIQALTQKSQALQQPAQSISIINGPLLLVGLGPFPQIIVGFTDIVSTANAAISQMQDMSPVPAGAQSDAIFNAFREFVRVHQTLLIILIGKAGLFETVPVIGQPVAAALGPVESVVDTIAFRLIDKVQSRASDLQNQADSLIGTLKICIDAYQGIQTSKAKRTLRFARRGVAATA